MTTLKQRAEELQQRLASEAAFYNSEKSLGISPTKSRVADAYNDSAIIIRALLAENEAERNARGEKERELNEEYRFAVEQLNRAADLEARFKIEHDNFERECRYADKICNALGFRVEEARTEGGGLRVGRILDRVKKILGDATNACLRLKDEQNARVAVERDTIERCAKVCANHPGNLENNNWSSEGALRDCVARLRALESAVGTVSWQSTIGDSYDYDSKGSDRGQQGVRSVRIERAEHPAGFSDDSKAGRVHDETDTRGQICCGQGSGRLSDINAALEPREVDRANPYPEAFCERCHRPNVTWFAPSDLWNKAVRVVGAEEILCPVCFIQLAEAAGIQPTAWKITPEACGPATTLESQAGREIRSTADPVSGSNSSPSPAPTQGDGHDRN